MVTSPFSFFNQERITNLMSFYQVINNKFSIERYKKIDAEKVFNKFGWLLNLFFYETKELNKDTGNLEYKKKNPQEMTDDFFQTMEFLSASLKIYDQFFDRKSTQEKNDENQDKHYLEWCNGFLKNENKKIQEESSTEKPIPEEYKK